MTVSLEDHQSQGRGMRVRPSSFVLARVENLGVVIRVADGRLVHDACVPDDVLFLLNVRVIATHLHDELLLTVVMLATALLDFAIVRRTLRLAAHGLLHILDGAAQRCRLFHVELIDRHTQIRIVARRSKPSPLTMKKINVVTSVNNSSIQSYRNGTVIYITHVQ